MCGGDLEIAAGVTVAECEYCGTKQTLPKANDEVVQNLFNRANNLRLKSEFDKAEQIYEKILQENDAEAEAHWGIVLCKYGIEYVEDPKTYKRIPTCHRTSYDAVTTDADYLAAIEHADAVQRNIYEAEAKAIDEIQKNILGIVKNEKPFDVFICYKESDENGKRTVDSVIANDIYHQLTQEGLKVFYAAITLEDKLGQEYEPYIFAALNSAKVMLVIGTKPQYFSAVWVKNEWSRFLKLMKADRSKLLIPCYKDMDAYDLPEEFSHLQAQDMSKIGFINDVVRGIRKVAVKDEPLATVVKETVVAGNANTAPLLKRAFMFLEDGDWDSANEYCEKVLDLDPECAEAYLGKLMAELRVKKQESLQDQAEPFDGRNTYQKALRFADDNLKTALAGYIEHINTRNETRRLEGIYTKALHKMTNAYDESTYVEAEKLFRSISHYKDAAALADQCVEKAAICVAREKEAEYISVISKMNSACTELDFKVVAAFFERFGDYQDAVQLKNSCLEKAEEARKDTVLANGKSKMTGNFIPNIESAIKLFESIPGWKDADEQIQICEQKIEELKAKAEADRLERERKKELARIEVDKQEKKQKKTTIIVSIAVCAVLALLITWATVIHPNSQYNDAIALMDAGNYEEAISAFEKLDGHKDSTEMLNECKYIIATNLLNAGSDKEAAFAFGEIGEYKDAKTQAMSLWSTITDRSFISAGIDNTVGLKANGTVVVTGSASSGRGDVINETDIIDISAGAHHTVGLKADGTVVAVGDDLWGQCDVSNWADIVAISAGASHTVGLKADGTVVAAGRNSDGECNVSKWTGIVAISAGDNHTVGLKADGTIVAVGDNSKKQCNTAIFTNIIAISAGDNHTVGLKADGTVVATGVNASDVRKWTDIIAISAGYYHTMGLKADGTVVAVCGSSFFCDGQCEVSDWSGIVEISAGDYHTVGLKADGTVVAVGKNDKLQCNVSGWTNIKTN